MPDARVKCRRYRTARRAALALVLLAGTGAGCANRGADVASTATGPFVVTGVTNVVRIAQVTGPQSPNKTDRFEVAGQDLGSMFQADGKTWFVFGDTFGRREPGLTGGGGGEWRSNALAYTTDTSLDDGIRLDGYIVDEQGWAKELLSSEKVDGSEMTVIPTYGFAANGAMYLAYMSVRHWADPGEWETNEAGFAKSIDHGHTWTKLASPRWAGDSNFVQVSVSKHDGDLYFWGVTHGRFGGVQLMKVAESDVESQSAYRYFSGTAEDGTPIWSADQAAAKTIVDDTVGELSVVWNDHLSRWLMTYTNGGNGDTSLREGITPWGPWGDAKTLVSASDVPGLYAPYLSPLAAANSGSTIYFTLSVWDPYNVFWYKADLVSRS
jgi:D-arabinan endo alpha-(1,5)-arabinofuranosidase